VSSDATRKPEDLKVEGSSEWAGQVSELIAEAATLLD
jgi:hypothetical protein